MNPIRKYAILLGKTLAGLTFLALILAAFAFFFMVACHDADEQMSEMMLMHLMVK